MKGIICKSLIISLTLCGLALAKPMPIPNLPSKEVRTIKVSMDPPDALSKTKAFAAKIILLEAPKSMTSTLEKNGEGYVITSEGVLNNGAKSTTVLNFSANGELKLKDMNLSIKSPDGKLMRKDYLDFSNRQFRYPRNLVHPMLLDVALRGLDPTSNDKYSFDLWLTPYNVLTMDVRVRGTEKVKVPAGEFDCYKVEMVPNLEELLGKLANKAISPFVPKFYFWIDTKGHHAMVKNEGKLGTVGAPLQTFELSKYEVTP